MYIFTYLSLICFSKIRREKADCYGNLKFPVFPMPDLSLTLVLELMLIHSDGDFAFPQE